MAKVKTIGEVLPTYEGPIFDCDSHIWERDYDFLRKYLPQDLHAEWLVARKVGPDGRFGLHIGDRMVENAESNAQGLVPPPGKLKEWLQAMKEGKSNVEGWGLPTEDMMEPAARLAKLDEFGVEGCILFVGEFVSTFGYFPQDATGARVLHAYNEYLHEHWGFAYQNRVFSTGLLSLWDLEAAIAEARWLVERGVRVVCMPMGPAGGRSPADPYFDPVWQILNDAKVAVTFHVSEANFMHPLIREFGETPLQSRRTGQTAWQWMFCYSELPVQITMANIIYHNFFERFPEIRIASVENGANWVPSFLEKMDKMRGMAKNGYWPCGQLKERPSAIFKRHCFAVAYPEDDVKGVVERIGTADCILMGSDYPHAEGVPEPRDFYGEALTELPYEQARAIMYDNGKRFMRL
ncbi:amidohydrolase family protein [Phenylobacterium sp. LjRoot225]|uniref:amidohydrolase family protein n=1 Tax=Phenylobacterium sp. LjRoot225 TaxID=3342285 RepID=UPI003ECE1150